MHTATDGRRRELITALLCLVAVAVLGFQVATGGSVVEVDTAVRTWVLGTRVPEVQRLLAPLVYLGYAPVVLPITFVTTILVSIFRATIDVVALALIVIFGLVVVGFTLKILVSRPSPNGLLPPLDGAWPSGHAMTVTVAAGILAELARTSTRRGLRCARATAFMASIAVGGALLYGDSHWLSDVVAGLLLGWAIVILARVVTRSLREKPAPGGDEQRCGVLSELER